MDQRLEKSAIKTKKLKDKMIRKEQFNKKAPSMFIGKEMFKSSLKDSNKKLKKMESDVFKSPKEDNID